MECPNLPKCPIWVKFNTDSKFFWINSYCKGEFNRCARKQLKDAGKEVPLSLLPNGISLGSLVNKPENDNATPPK